eukprot:scaffold8699_cov65-Phaeocystis_antarctica.AAC.1
MRCLAGRKSSGATVRRAPPTYSPTRNAEAAVAPTTVVTIDCAACTQEVRVSSSGSTMPCMVKPLT